MKELRPGHCRFCLADLTVEPVREWDIWLPLEPPSQNVVSGNAKDFAKRRAYQTFRDEYRALLEREMARLQIPVALDHRRVKLTRHYGPRGQAYDYGNLVGGMKPLLDAMTAVGLIHDDSERWISDYYQQRQTGASGVNIEIEELI